MDNLTRKAKWAKVQQRELHGISDNAGLPGLQQRLHGGGDGGGLAGEAARLTGASASCGQGFGGF